MKLNFVEDMPGSEMVEAPVAVHRLQGCRLAARHKDLAVEDSQLGVAAEDTEEEEPIQADEATARQADNVG